MRHEQLGGQIQTQQRQHQKQRQQQQHQQEQQHPYAGLGRDLPEKQHQSKPNPISEATKVAQHGSDK